VDPNVPQTDLSKLFSAWWKHESDDVRLQYAQRANEAAQLHRIMYPDYRYQPRKREKRLQMALKTSSSADTESSPSPNLSSPIGPHARPSVPITKKSDENVGVVQHMPFYHSDTHHSSSNDTIAQPEATPSNVLGLWLFFPDSGTPTQTYYAAANPSHMLLPEWGLQEPTSQDHTVSQFEADTPAQWWPRHQFVGDDARAIPAPVATEAGLWHCQ
jgi:hypothetical protein